MLYFARKMRLLRMKWRILLINQHTFPILTEIKIVNVSHFYLFAFTHKYHSNKIDGKMEKMGLCYRDASEIQFPFVCKRRRVLLRHARLISPRTLP